MNNLHTKAPTFSQRRSLLGANVSLLLNLISFTIYAVWSRHFYRGTNCPLVRAHSWIKAPTFRNAGAFKTSFFPVFPLFTTKVTALLVINLLLTEFYAVSTGYNL